MYDSELFAKARLFIYRNARALDLARWRFHFEDADKSEVLAALSAYQNKDGGFGWALEADAWNPNSSPPAMKTIIQQQHSPGSYSALRMEIHRGSSWQTA